MKGSTLKALTIAGAVAFAWAVTPGLAWSQGNDAPAARPQPGCPCAMGDEGMMRHGGRMGWERHGGPGHQGGGLGLEAYRRLDLSEAQRTQLTKIENDFRHDNWTTLGKLLDARASQRELESTSQPDPKKVGTAFAEVSKLEQALLEARVQSWNQARAVLTPEQRQQLDQLREGRRGIPRGPRTAAPGSAQ